MSNVIYVDGACGIGGIPLNNTPAGIYAVTNLSDILDRIADGTIVTGTGKPYVTEWKEFTNSVDVNDVPWYTNG